MSKSLKAEVKRLRKKLSEEVQAKCQLYLDGKKIINQLSARLERRNVNAP